MKPISEGGGGLTATPLSFGATNLGNLDTDPDTTTSNVGDIYYNTVTGVVKLLVDDGGGLIWYDIGRNISIGKTQVTGTAVTLSDVGTITSDMIGNTQVTVSKLATSSVTNTKVSTTANIDVTKIAGTAAALTTANTFTVGQQVIKTGADGNPGVSIWRNSGTQSAALLSLFQSDGSTVLAQVSAAGNVSLRNDNGAAAGVPLSITANASQSSNLLQILGSDNSTVRASISSVGALTVSPSSGTAATINAAASGVGVVVEANATTPGDLQRWQANGGSVYSRINASGQAAFGGRLTVGASNVNSTSVLYVTASTTTQITSAIQALTAQTSDLTQWLNTAGTVLGGRNAAGQTFAGSTAAVVGSTTTALTSAQYTSATVAVFTYGGTSLVQAGQTVTVAGVTGGAYNGTWVVSAVTSTTFTVLGSGFTNNAGTGGTFKLSAVGSFTAGTAAITPVVVKAAESQSANIQEWQNSSGGSLATIYSNGGALFPYIGSASNQYLVSTENSGGLFQAVRQTAAAANPGANSAKLYFRDGTTTGTLKLVVRAGTAGAETTILDNIPQT